MKIFQWIAKTGSNPSFIAFMAHFWFAYALVLTAAGFKFGFKTAMIVLLVAMVKEFWFDKHYETGQSFRDNLLDWVGYAGGSVLAIIIGTYL